MAQLLAEIIERCRKGDQSAYKIVVKRYQNKALDLARALVGDRHLAEDVIQEAFLKVFCRLDQLREPEAFVGWLRQIVRTEAIKVIRRDSRKVKQDEILQNEQLSPSEMMESEELRQIIHRALSELSGANRETAKMFYLDEQSCDQVARTLNVPAGTVRRRLHDSRNKLREMLLGYIQLPEGKKKRKYDKQIPF